MKPHTSFTALPSLTVIISLRLTRQRRDLLDRLDYYKFDTELPEQVDFIVVDDGSPDEYFKEILRKHSDNMTVLRTGAKNYQDFSLARARNYGAQRAKGRFVMFMDADLIPYPGFFKDVLRELKLTEMTRHVDRFLMFPVIYLTDKGYEEMRQLSADCWKQYSINAMLSDDKTLIEKFSSGTSVIALDRHYYLSRGGQDEDFEGWGYEDYEFATRLIRRNRKFPLPDNWLSMAGNFMTIRQYEGWKAAYRLYGDWMAAKGIYLLHAPHPIESTYHRRKDQNLRYLQQKMKDDQRSPQEPDPLPSLDAGHSLLLRKNPFCFDREFAPFLGRISHATEKDFATTTEFSIYLAKNNVTQVIFGNPYANDQLLSLYQWCRQNSFPIRVCERGALPDAVYHDPNGFLNDSSSYFPEKWDFPLNDEQRDEIASYISALREGGLTLEKQAPREDLAELKKKLGIKRKQKVLVVPFQQPNDTVVRYFSGGAGSGEGFRKRIAELVVDLGDSWKVVYKKHPVEDELAPIAGASAAHEANIYDLLEIADAVAVINSGVGLYAMMFGKPLYVFGNSWYGYEGLCRPIRADEDAAEVIRRGFELDYERVLAFAYYLRFKFYSFGKMQARKVRYEDGSPITATTAISYYELRGWSEQTRCLPAQWKPIPTSSPMFDRYRSATGVVGAQPAKSVKAPTAAASPATDIKVKTGSNPLGSTANGNGNGNGAAVTKLGVPPVATPSANAKQAPQKSSHVNGVSTAKGDAAKPITVNNEQSLIRAGARAYHQGNYQEAAKFFDDAVKVRSANISYLRLSAEAHFLLGNKDVALARLAAAQAIAPANKNLHDRIRAMSAPAWKRLVIKSKPYPVPKE